MNAWSRQLAHPNNGYTSPYHQVWADVRTKDAKPKFQGDTRHKRDLWGYRTRRLDPELKARRDLQRQVASDPVTAAWWRGLTPAQANAAVADLAAGRISM